jgi:MarR family 2-MHQ and catechol resistance regulon transcriptional repressor
MPTRYKGSPEHVQALDTFIKLSRALNTINGRIYSALLRDEGLTISQLAVLEALLHIGSMPQTQLCAKILRSGSNITTVVDNLERDGLVRRERQESDRRVQVVHLTDAGRKLIIRAFPSHVRRIADTFSVLSRDEQQELARLCRKLGLGQPPS